MRVGLRWRDHPPSVGGVPGGADALAVPLVEAAVGPVVGDEARLSALGLSTLAGLVVNLLSEESQLLLLDVELLLELALGGTDAALAALEGGRVRGAASQPLEAGAVASC